MSRLDPEPRRCGTCMIRLSRVGPDHEEACSREANGRPPFVDDYPTAEEIAAPPPTVATLEARRGR